MYGKYIKRIFDLLLALIAIILLSPVLLIVSILIKCDSKGPVIFKQQRLGVGGVPFEMYKFRSMVVDAESQGSRQYSYKNDPRVTKVGKIIRATSIDELPQLINILKGEMSFIGPRPALTYHPWPIEEYSAEQLKMFDTPPGITGWAQVNGRKTVEWNKRIELNVWYVENLSIMLDLKIFFLTIYKVFVNADNESKEETVMMKK